MNIDAAANLTRTLYTVLMDIRSREAFLEGAHYLTKRFVEVVDEFGAIGDESPLYYRKLARIRDEFGGFWADELRVVRRESTR